jgi:hypothetical protein
VEEWYRTVPSSYLSEINLHFLNHICHFLNIKTPLLRPTDQPLQTDKSSRLVFLCKQHKATEYYSGPSAVAYLNQELFANEKISVNWFDYSGYSTYDQLYPPFQHQVSIIDLLFNEGIKATTFMKNPQ